MNRVSVFVLLIISASVAYAFPPEDPEISGSFGIESRTFFNSGMFSPDLNNMSFFFEPQISYEWEERRELFIFTAFFRWDETDTERTHFDIREFSWEKAFSSWDLRLGVRKVFWGVTESQHLVDIINQTDFVENLDGEDKLGQPMINLAWISDLGTIDFYVLPYFRERPFSSSDARFSLGVPVDQDNPTYESSAEENHIDLAVRWSQQFGGFDLGLSHFYGTSREPRLIPTSSDDTLKLTPQYDLIHQTALDLQYIFDNWAWKAEVISRQQNDDRFFASTAGFEYTFYTVISAADIGVLVEHLYDDRDEMSTTGFQNDIFVGSRIALNDVQSSELLVGMIFDLDSSETFFNIEASRRIGDRIKVSLENRTFMGAEQGDFFYNFRNDDYFQIEISWFL